MEGFNKSAFFSFRKILSRQLTRYKYQPEAKVRAVVGCCKSSRPEFDV
jgi:hypothetical protein